MMTMAEVRTKIERKLLRFSENAPDLWDVNDLNGVALMVAGLAIGKVEDLRTRFSDDAVHTIAADSVLADVERLFGEEIALLRQCWAEIAAAATRDDWQDHLLQERLLSATLQLIGAEPARSPYP